MAAWTAVLASIIASTLLVEPASGPMAGPAIRVHVDGDRGDPRVSLLRGAAAVRVLERDGCLTTGSADVTVHIEVGRDDISVLIDDGATVRHHVAPGSDALAALEVLHRLEAGLRAADPTVVHGPVCREDALVVQARGDRDAPWVGQWLAGLSRSGRPLVRAPEGEAQVCLRHDGEALVVGRGGVCTDAVRISTESREITDEAPVDQAVGAALALSSPRAEPKDAPVPAQPQPEPEVATPVPVPVPHSQAEPEPAPIATLHVFVGGAPSIRPGGLDGAALGAVGVALGPGPLLAAEVMMLPAPLEESVVAIDTDLLGSAGYRLRLARRSGLRGALSAGARLHTWRVARGRTRVGDPTWVVGGELAGWWRVGRFISLEFGVRQQHAGRGWIHEVGLRRAGERGRSTTTMFAGLGWIGSRR